MTNTQPAATPPAAIPQATAATTTPPQQEWKGLTIDELKMRRAKALVMREVNRASISYQFASMRNDVSQKGVRGLLFSNKTVSGLKKADYAVLGARALRLLIKLYTRRRR
jgi:hypothetical protein